MAWNNWELIYSKYEYKLIKNRNINLLNIKKENKKRKNASEIKLNQGRTTLH